ncbi:unnamed protein product [Brassica rapa subsp. narinosa]
MRDTQAFLLEEESVLLIEWTHGSLSRVTVKLRKIRVSFIRYFELLKTHDLSLHGGNECVAPG